MKEWRKIIIMKQCCLWLLYTTLDSHEFFLMTKLFPFFPLLFFSVAQGSLSLKVVRNYDDATNITTFTEKLKFPFVDGAHRRLLGHWKTTFIFTVLYSIGRVWARCVFHFVKNVCRYILEKFHGIICDNFTYYMNEWRAIETQISPHRAKDSVYIPAHEL